MMKAKQRHCHECGLLVEPRPVVLHGVDRTWSPPAMGMGTLVPESEDISSLGADILLSHSVLNHGFGYCPICGARLVW